MQTRRDILALAWPAVIDNLLHTLTLTADMIMVGSLGADYLASVGLGGQVVFIFQSLMIAVTAGTVAMVARSIGEENIEQARHVLEQSLVSGAAGAFLLTPFLYFFAGGLLQIYQAEKEVLALGSQYLEIAALGIGFIFICLASAQALRGAGDTKTPLIISSLINVTNVGLNYILIFGKLGFEPMGVKGAALGTTISFVVGASIYLVLLKQRKLKLYVSFRRFSLDSSTVRKVLNVGTPAALEQLVIQIGFLAYMVIITSFGTESIAAHQIGIRIQSFAFMPGFGFAIAATALVGQNLGAGKPAEAEKSGWEACRLSLVLMGIVGILIFIFARDIAVIFVREEAVIDRAVIFIRLLAFGMPGIATHFTLGGALRGAGDTKWPLYASTVGLYGFRIPLAMALGFSLGWGVVGAWIAMVVEYAARAFFVALRFKRGGWKRIQVL
ncbi:MAG: MATE family efflux transporter [Theionarchaea archaeon]|nr:MATE family efflux transporter [Theionarchaea archaeon]MBU7038071.1 MATE family efflux transporter [Theionarchaea archaeon]